MNAILTEELQNRTGPKMLRAYDLQNRGFQPKIHWLDNKASNKWKEFNIHKQIEFQLVPPHMPRRNAAKRAIQTWKNHVIAGLCSTDTRFLMHLWDRLMAQSTITLNLLRPSRRNLKILAYNMLEGNFDYNKTPLALPGTKVIIHEKPPTLSTCQVRQMPGSAYIRFICFLCFRWAFWNFSLFFGFLLCLGRRLPGPVPSAQEGWFLARLCDVIGMMFQATMLLVIVRWETMTVTEFFPIIISFHSVSLHCSEKGEEEYW
jgi:hypothetical protein